MNIYSTLKRNPGTKSDGNNFTQTEINAVWQKGGIVTGRDPGTYRSDACGKLIKLAEHGNTNSDQGWEIDHKQPVSKNGSDYLTNLQPLYWKTNREKGDTYPWSCR